MKMTTITDNNMNSIDLNEYDLIDITEIQHNVRKCNTYDIEVENSHKFLVSNPANEIEEYIVSHNSAEIAIGDPDDYLFLRAKRWDLGNIPNWRGMSNNSIYVDNYSQISNEVWNGYTGNGEPYGFINLPLCQTQGRLGEYRVDNCVGTNPCAEANLEDGEACNLSELYLNNIRSQEELNDCARLLYKTQKAIWTLPAISEKTQKIAMKNMRIGMGVTGICQVSDEKLQWLSNTYTELRRYDKEWSTYRGWAESIKLTTVKPSGTVSLLSGSTPGIHPAYSQYYIRRVRIGSDDKLIKVCKELGFAVKFVENFDGSLDHKTCIVEFPCTAGESTILAKDVSAIDQLELVKKVQTIWSDMSISCTVYYKKDELSNIKEWLKNNYANSVKTASFLLHSDHGFKQAPYEEITKEQYKKLIAGIKPINVSINIGSELLDNMECTSGACPIR